MLFLDSVIFTISPFSAKVVVYSRIYKTDVRLLNTIDSYQLTKILLLSKYFLMEIDEKIFDFCKR